MQFPMHIHLWILVILDWCSFYPQTQSQAVAKSAYFRKLSSSVDYYSAKTCPWRKCFNPHCLIAGLCPGIRVCWSLLQCVQALWEECDPAQQVLINLFLSGLVWGRLWGCVERAAGGCKVLRGSGRKGTVGFAQRRLKEQWCLGPSCSKPRWSEVLFFLTVGIGPKLWGVWLGWKAAALILWEAQGSRECSIPTEYGKKSSLQEGSGNVYVCGLIFWW